MKTTTWTTADGREIAIKDLGDKHLYNILKMVDETLASRPTSSVKLPTAHLKKFDALAAEAIRRGLYAWSDERIYLDATVRRVAAIK